MIVGLDEKMSTIALCGVRCTVLTLSVLYGHFSGYFPIPFRLEVIPLLANVTVVSYRTDDSRILGGVQINDLPEVLLLCYF